ncbi:MAG: glycosyltransferase, partial [Gammaproteobacteria bacterium]
PSETERQAARNRLCLPPGEVVFVTIGNCNSTKNHQELIRALAGLPPGRRPIWLHVGEEDSGCTERQLAESLEISEQVRFCGAQTDVLPYLHASDLYVMPSLYEGFSIAVLEAFAVGLPAILSDVPGLRDWSGQVPGVIFAKPHAAALREALKDFLERDLNSWKPLVVCHPAVVQKNYSVASAVASYVALYKGERLAGSL